MNGCAPGLALIERLKATRKWAIHAREGILATMVKKRPWDTGVGQRIICFTTGV